MDPFENVDRYLRYILITSDGAMTYKRDLEPSDYKDQCVSVLRIGPSTHMVPERLDNYDESVSVKLALDYFPDWVALDDWHDVHCKSCNEPIVDPVECERCSETVCEDCAISINGIYYCHECASKD